MENTEKTKTEVIEEILSTLTIDDNCCGGGDH